MKVLIDTHIAIWAISDDPRLSQAARDILTNTDNEVYYSVVSVWETVIKHMIRPHEVQIDGDELATWCNETGFQPLPIVNHHAVAVKTLRRKDGAPPHNDPFDRMLIAQAKTEGMLLMTHDSLIPGYDENCILSV